MSAGSGLFAKAMLLTQSSYRPPRHSLACSNTSSRGRVAVGLSEVAEDKRAALQTGARTSSVQKDHCWRAVGW
eukprot:3546767-Rhodomonas_salina.1